MRSPADQPWYAALPESPAGPLPALDLRTSFAVELRKWVGEALGARGSELVGLEPVHQRPWSTGVAGDGGGRHDVVGQAQNCPHQAFEAALMVELTKLAPERVVPVAAADRRPRALAHA